MPLWHLPHGWGEGWKLPMIDAQTSFKRVDAGALSGRRQLGTLRPLTPRTGIAIA